MNQLYRLVCGFKCYVINILIMVPNTSSLCQLTSAVWQSTPKTYWLFTTIIYLVHDSVNWLGSSSLDQLISAELSHASVAAVGLEVDDLRSRMVSLCVWLLASYQPRWQGWLGHGLSSSRNLVQASSHGSCCRVPKSNKREQAPMYRYFSRLLASYLLNFH